MNLDNNQTNDMTVLEKENEIIQEAIEKRKKWNFTARFTISGVIFNIFFVLLYVLFFQEVSDKYRDIINILIGTYVAVLTKTVDYWFKEKDDPEHRESENLNGNPTE
jgi:hypothetical protein